MRTFRLIIATLFVLTKAVSQIYVSGTLFHTVDDNVDNNAYQLSDRITVLAVDAGYSIGETTVFDISYSGMGQYFAKYKDHTASLHQLSLSYFPSLSDNESMTLMASLGALRRFGRESYTVYDHSLYYGECRFTYQWNTAVRSTLVYTLNSVQFLNIENFDFVEHRVQLQTLTFFPSRTTLIVRGEFAAKIYDPLRLTITDTIASSSPTQGHGNSGPPQTVLTTRTTHITGPSATSSQVKAYLRIAQGITTTTGVAATMAYQWNLKKEPRYFVTSDGSVPDDELFDNPYGYEGFLWGGMVTQTLPLHIMLRLSYWQQRKTFSTLPAYNTNGTVISDHRLDTRQSTTLSIEKELTPFTFSVAYDYITNKSNDPLYTYTNCALTILLAVTL